MEGFRKIASWRRVKIDETGSVTVEFVILFPLFITLIYWIFETGYVAFSALQLDRGLTLATRELFVTDFITANGLTPGEAHTELVQRICGFAMLPDCQDNIQLELRRMVNWGSTLDTDLSCVNRTTGTFDDLTVNSGDCIGSVNLTSKLYMLRACFIVDPFMPSAFGLMQAGAAEDGGIRLSSIAAYVHEPCAVLQSGGG